VVRVVRRRWGEPAKHLEGGYDFAFHCLCLKTLVAVSLELRNQ